MSLGPYIRYLGNPLVQLGEVLGAVGLLVWATRLEQARETEAAPRIILPYGTGEPERPKRHWFWVKIGGILAVIAVIFITVSALSHHIPSKKAQLAVVDSPKENTTPIPPTATPGTSPSVHRPTINPKAEGTQISQPTTSNAKPKPEQSDKPAPAPVLDLPKALPSKPTQQSTVVYTATINNQTVKGGDKPHGALYVSLRVTPSSKYTGAINQAEVESIRDTLTKTGKVTVFVNTGAYTVSSNGLEYGVNLSPAHARTIYYFDSSLDSTCSAIKNSIESIVGGQMACKFLLIEPSKDPLEPNIAHDFLVASGIDMEIIL